jgi:uncharacterized membrane protein YadS
MSEQDYSWAAYLDYMEGGGSDVVSLPAARPVGLPKPRQEHPVWGVLAALGVTVVALWLGQLRLWPFTVTTGQRRVSHPVEPVMIALFLGIVVSNLWTLPKFLQPGIKFSVKKLLPVGIVLLGARLDFGEMLKVGLTGLLLSGLETVVALGLLLLLARWLDLPRKLGILLGVGTAICGGTAIVATAPVIGAEAIHQTPQVVAAGYAYSPSNADYSPIAGDTATIVKMARVCLLAPVVFLIGLMHARSKARESSSAASRKINYLSLFPMFVLGFLGMALLNTMGLLPELTFRNAGWLGTGTHAITLASAAEQGSRFCILLSMAAVGLETRFAAMRQTGMKPFFASFSAVLLLAVMLLGLIKALAI